MSTADLLVAGIVIGFLGSSAVWYLGMLVATRPQRDAEDRELFRSSGPGPSGNADSPQQTGPRADIRPGAGRS